VQIVLAKNNEKLYSFNSLNVVWQQNGGEVAGDIPVSSAVFIAECKSERNI